MARSSDIEYEGNGQEIEWKNTYTTDEESASSNSPSSYAAQRAPTAKRCTSCLKTIIFGVVLLVVLAVGLSVAFLGSPNPIEFFVQEDPPGRNETHQWRLGGRDGLELILENALVDRWIPYLDEYVEKWDAGYADVDPLTLSVRRVEVESDCYPSPGRLKVCNGNYGATDWRGINILLLREGFIAHSVAKLNDYWLDREGTIQQRYTMCHELGHGFGLAHTDENYWNVNTGECMDYTTRPQSNLDPGSFNFDLLASIYGTPRYPLDQRVPANRRTGEVVEEDSVPESISSKYYRAVTQVEGMVCKDCLVDLGDGYQLEVHQLSVE